MEAILLILLNILSILVIIGLYKSKSPEEIFALGYCGVPTIVFTLIFDFIAIMEILNY